MPVAGWRRAVEAVPARAFGSLLRRYRSAAGLTQGELAERAGLSVRGISDLERGVKAEPRKDTVLRLADALRLAPAERALFEGARRRMAFGSGANVDTTGNVAPWPPSSAAAPPIVGRARELAALGRHLDGEGPPALLFAGEPGIGKSRLLHEARRLASVRGWRVLAGGCPRRDGQEPYAPLLQAVAAHVHARTPAQLRPDLRGCAWLVRLVPELVSGPIEPLPGWALPPAQERRLMVEAARRFTDNVAGPAGTLLVLDDLQWAGTDALGLLAALLDAPASPVRLVGAYRSTEVAPRDALARALAALADRGMAAHLELKPLAPEEVRQLLDALLEGSGDDSPALWERLVQRTGGVPFFVVSCAQALRTGAAGEGRDGDLPWDAAQSIRQRVAALPDPAQDVLGVAAVAGREVHPDVIVAASDLGQRAVLAALDAAGRARLLVDNGQLYRFAHDLIREVVEADVGAARRTLLHRRIAEALERDQGEPAAEALAYHYGRAGAPEKSMIYLEQAGDRAWARHANAAAEGHYRDLVEGLDRLGRALDGARAREKLAAVLTMAGRYDEVSGALERAAETYRATGDLESLAHVMAKIGSIHTGTGTESEGVERLWRLAAQLEAHVPSRGLVALYASLADLLFSIGRYRDNLATAKRAVELARMVGDRGSLARALWFVGVAHLGAGHLAESRRALEGAIELTGETSELDLQADPPLLLSLVLLRRGELEESARWCERGLALAERSGFLIYMTVGTGRRGIVAYVRGDWARARRDGERALAWGRRLGRSWASRRPLTTLGLVCYGEGRWEDARRYLEERMAAREGHQPGEHVAPGLLAELDIREGRPERAKARLAALLAAAAESGADASLMRAPYAWAHLVNSRLMLHRIFTAKVHRARA